MADQIRPTPRSPILGLFSDLVNLPLQYMSDVNRTQQMRGMADFIRSTGVPSTLERLSYGQGLFTGAGGLGGTTRLRPEVAEAALTVAPMVGPAAKLAGRAVMATKGLPVGASIQDVGQLSIARGTNPVQGAAVLIGDRIFVGRTHGDALNRAVYEGVVRKEGGKYIYPKGAEVDMDLFMLNDGRIVDRLTAYKELDVGAAETAIEKGLMQNTPGRSMTVDEYMKQAKALKQERERTPSYPQEEALRLAQQRAALPVSEGGLGLPPNNTPMDRARAMGFESGWAHGSPRSDITELRSSRIGAQGPGAYATNYLPEASTYSQTGEGATVYPLMVRRSEALNTKFNNPYDELGVNADDALLSELFGRGKSAIVTTQEKTPDWLLRAGAPDMPERQHFVSVRPENFRSRFAAFDPTRRNEPDLLAGALPFTALLDEENRQAIGEFLTNPIMYRDPFGSTVR